MTNTVHQLSNTLNRHFNSMTTLKINLKIEKLRDNVRISPGFRWRYQWSRVIRSKQFVIL